jgi:predicted DNA binding protein
VSDVSGLCLGAELSLVRFVTFELVPPGEYLHPVERAVAEAGLDQVAIHQFRALADETGVRLYELRGEPGTADAVLADHPDVESHDVVGSGSELFVHARFELNDLTAGVYRVQREHDLVFDLPMRYVDGGTLEVTAVGDFERFRAAVGDVPDSIRLELVRTGEYTPDGGHLFAELTKRQQETLRAAVGTGYYEEPRECSYEAIADRLDVAAGTVGEHLRKIEATVMKSVVPDADAGRPDQGTDSG